MVSIRKKEKAITEPMVEACPTCRRPFRWTPTRICFDCKKPILKMHKWTTANGTIRHRDCSDPESYPEKMV
jgi:hypothetical protein